ncbi:MAG TPA: N-acetylglucosamine-6-phosphate deacetylase [Balneolaceae bacterium]|nr:N-acetylglucosamine-6-phosphate deacetylase [Balneolaceae bacterium]
MSFRDDGKNIAQVRGKLVHNGQRVSISISEGIITDITPDHAREKSRGENLFVAPGLIDNQVNGYMGIDFTEPDLSVEEIKKVTRALWKKGVTTYLPTLISNSPDRWTQNLKILAGATGDDEIGGSIPGFHLEGPYISPQDGFRGTHDKKWIREPDWTEFEAFMEASGGHILQITLAPELNRALEFIRKLREKDIVAALGHHNASSEIIEQAVNEGASVATHLGNGCANFIHRHHNPLWPQLAEDRLTASIIVDGRHLTNDEVRTFYKAKGASNLILTSDITKFAGMQPGEYVWDGRKIQLTEDGYIRDVEQDVLAGSALTLDKGLENMTAFTGCPLATSLRMATQNPAKIYGFEDRGVIEEGKRADLILFDFDEGNLSIKETIVNGNVVFRK